MCARQSKKGSFPKYEVAGYQKDAMCILLPPDDLSVSEWSEQYRILDSKTSAMPGPWSNQMTPYLCEIMDAMTVSEIEEIVFVKPTQVGGSEAMLNMLGYVIMQDPGAALVIYPSDELAKSISINRLEPMLLVSPALRGLYRRRESTDLELQFSSMYLSLNGANSPGDLASKSIRYLFLDEVDKFPGASKKEADPVNLARERTKTYSNRKIYMTSTPTLKTGLIWKSLQDADIVKHYFVPCPHCNEFIELKMAQIKWPDKSETMNEVDRAQYAQYICQECGCVITDRDKPNMLRKGEWRIAEQRKQCVRKVGFWLNTLYSPFVSFAEIAEEWIKSQSDPERLHNFINSWLAEPWENAKVKTSETLVLERQTDLEMFKLPEWAKLLTGGVDVQKTCLYWTIRAWGDSLTSQNIAHGQALSFDEVTRVMNLEYRKADGSQMLVDLALVDSGDQTDDVYDYCAENSDWALPCKGSSTSMLSHYKLSVINKETSKACGITLVLVDGGKYKDMIAGRLQKVNGRGSWMVYRDCDMDYAKQVTAEQKVAEGVNDRERTFWKKKSSHAANHYLDCEVYAMAAADVLGVRSLFLQEDSAGQQVKEAPKVAPVLETEEDWINSNDDW